jgi:predicted CopG family antitoxin
LRTTISIPDELYSEAKQWAGDRSFSDFASEAIHDRVKRLKFETLAREMEMGYRAEAESSSLDPEWSAIEVDGL